jgi:hypothetical protein
MDDFDRLLERELRLILDAVVASPAPARRAVAQPGATFLTLAPLPVEPAVATMPDHPAPPFC